MLTELAIVSKAVGATPTDLQRISTTDIYCPYFVIELDPAATGELYVYCAKADYSTEPPTFNSTGKDNANYILSPGQIFPIKPPDFYQEKGEEINLRHWGFSGTVASEKVKISYAVRIL